MAMDLEFSLTFDNFNEGLAPLAHIDEDSFVGNKGQAGVMLADVISNPGFLTQSPGLQTLTNGDENGVVNEPIRFILDEPPTENETYALGTTKAFKINPTNVVNGGTPLWPKTVAGMMEGESISRLRENLFFFYNTSTGGDIASMPLDTQVINPNWGSITDQALENAPHPSASKEDMVLFGNGQYVGVFIQGSTGPGSLDVRKLDFGNGAEVADIVFSSNYWWITVNYGNGKKSQIYLYSAAAVTSVLDDETGIGDQRVGFTYVLNGIIYVAYDDKTSGGFAIGWLAGKQIKPLRYFKGTLPNHRQKSLYKNTIAFISGENIFSCGASVEQLPLQISALADGGYENVEAIASPFGTPLVSSHEDSHYKLAQFSGYSTESFWESNFNDLTFGRLLGRIQYVIVATKPLPEGAKCTIILEGNQGTVTSSPFIVEETGKTRHLFPSIDLSSLEDVRVKVSFPNGSAVNKCEIRKITVGGNYTEF